MCVCADADEEDFGEYVAHRTLYKCIDSDINTLLSSFAGLLFMVAPCNGADHYIFALWFLVSFFFFSSPNLSRRRLDVYHTSIHGVALVRI